jgi:ABC-type transport system involved in cytochrome c biogenesis ATPase subunit
MCGLIDNLAAGGAAIAVHGEPGIGKSSLLRAVADYGIQSVAQPTMQSAD